MKAYPRLRIWRQPAGEFSACWYVGLYRAENVLARSWWTFDYDHARRVAPEIWADRAIWLDR